MSIKLRIIWDSESTRKGENMRKPILRCNIKNNGHTEITEITEKDIAAAISGIRIIRVIRVQK